MERLLEIVNLIVFKNGLDLTHVDKSCIHMMLCTHFTEVFQVSNEDRDRFYEVGIYEAMA
jgi:hypothetical protein